MWFVLAIELAYSTYIHNHLTGASISQAKHPWCLHNLKRFEIIQVNSKPPEIEGTSLGQKCKARKEFKVQIWLTVNLVLTTVYCCIQSRSSSLVYIQKKIKKLYFVLYNTETNFWSNLKFHACATVLMKRIFPLGIVPPVLWVASGRFVQFEQIMHE
jgi:hypothetical protein